MAEIAYQFTINLFAFLIQFVAPFNRKIKLGVTGRKGLIDEMEKSFQSLAAGRPVVWFHAASLGEFEQGRPVMEAYRNQYPGHFILLTFFSPSGYEIRKSYSGADYICYLPFDTLSNAKRFVEIVNPRIVFFIKYEFWFNYLIELKKNGSYILSFSSIFRPGQVFFKSYGGFFRRMLESFNHIFVQNAQSIELLHGAGIMSCSIAGDTRFDRVKTIADNARDLPEIALFRNEKICMVAGSVWAADMQVLIPVLNGSKGKLKAIIAPHEIKKDEISGWRNSLEGKSLLYSELDKTADTEQFDYLIIDNIGMLSSLYRYGDMAYIGGSFGAGLHNILEAATFGLPIIFGNKGYHRFQEAVDLKEKGGAIAVADSDSARSTINQWIENPGDRMGAGKVNEQYVLSGIGATDTIMDKVKETLG
ncbi:3-deoxy-D-manno-octulosonic acid transferase [Dyadobacter pollutisoli]|uniref:3-deoxy-D-manno-octulosonic acid transferase n=1 Tax=Dyadobacter pollutisoli TaxID=2910158 RepID=A0A9E8N9E8_9BACT|nr:3-deoxy-D-manno-octulosonic acid transferase [Dyadobacter pollutisoli]